MKVQTIRTLLSFWSTDKNTQYFYFHYSKDWKTTIWFHFSKNNQSIITDTHIPAEHGNSEKQEEIGGIKQQKLCGTS